MVLVAFVVVALVAKKFTIEPLVPTRFVAKKFVEVVLVPVALVQTIELAVAFEIMTSPKLPFQRSEGVPIVLGMGGNVGIQSATIVTRGLALGRIDTKQLWQVFGKELLISTVCGVLYGVLLGLVAWAPSSEDGSSISPETARWRRS